MVLLLPPGRDILTGFSYIVPDCDGRTPDDGRTAPPPSLLECSLSDVAIVVLAAMPPSSEAEARAALGVVSLAVLAQATLGACRPLLRGTDDDAEELLAAQATDDDTGAQGGAQGGARYGARYGVRYGALEGLALDRESVEAHESLRSQLAEAARMRIEPDAPSGTALVLAVHKATRSFARVAALALDALVPPAEGGGGIGSSVNVHSSRASGDEAPSRAPLRPLPPPSASSLLACPPAIALVKRWAAAASASGGGSCERSQGGSPGRFVVPAAPKLPCLQLHAMPRDFVSLTALLHLRVCASCAKPPLEPALCLLCGALLCAGQSCRRPRMQLQAGQLQEGECTRHARRCGLGVGLFALVHQNLTLLVDETRSAYHASLYLDEHGEEDRGLRRGKPLFLNAARQAALHRLWLAQAVPLEVARSRSSTSSVIRLGYY